jgi:hypothetical protein
LIDAKQEIAKLAALVEERSAEPPDLPKLPPRDRRAVN